MTSRRAIVAALAFALVVLGILLWRSGRERVSAPHAVSTPTSGIGAPSGSAELTPVSRTAPPARSSLADALNAPPSDIQADLRIVSSIIETFRSNFLQTGNPVGTNAEITSALTGRNRLRLSLIPADHPAINAEGELCDRWGTPFFFHAESATRMEVRSAGPDLKMWSEDDAVFSP